MAYQVQEAKRFEFTVPGDKTVYSLPQIVDLPPAKFDKFKNAEKTIGDDLDKFKAMLVSMADDEPTKKALKTLESSQAIVFVKDWAGDAEVSLGELMAS